MTQTNAPVSITAKRTRPNVVQYSVTTHDPLYGDSTMTYLTNGVATFMVAHTGGTAFRLHGGTLWRKDDNEMAVAFRLAYRNIRSFSIA